MKRSRKVIAWVGGGLLIVVVALVLFLALFDWNRLKPFIDDKVSQAIGRPFAINGDLSVAWRREPGAEGLRGWLPWPQFTARDITIGNPDWAAKPQFAHLDALRFRLSPLPLLAHRIVVPSLQLVQPTVDLERDKNARDNWSFELPKHGGSSGWNLQLGDIGFDRGHIALGDARDDIELKIAIEPLQKAIPYRQVVAEDADAAKAQARTTVGAGAGKAIAAAENAPDAAADKAAQDTRYQFRWTAEGSYQGAAAKGSGRIGAVLALQHADRPFPVQARMQVGDTHIGLVGTLTDPLHLGALDLQLWFAGSSMAKLYPLIGVTLPDTRPYATRGHLKAELRDQGNHFSYQHFQGRVGDSDLSGDLQLVTGHRRPKLSGTLHSSLLEFGDLAPLIGADSNAQKQRRGDGTPQPPGKVLPVEPFRTDRWKAMNADVTFDAAHISHAEGLPIESLETHLVMDEGRLTLDPLQAALAGGQLHGTVKLNGSQTPMRGSVKLQARHLKLKQLFPTFAPMDTALGEINADTALSAYGNSVAALLGDADGEVKLLMNDGAISKTLLETAGLNLGNVAIRKLFGDKNVQINCAATDLDAKDGVFSTRLFVFDTTDALIKVDGTVNMDTERLDLTVKPQTKGLRIFSLRSPLYVRGTLKDPDVGVQAGPLALRAGGAVALGAVAAPAAALLALISPSHDQPQNTCQAVLKQLRTTGKLKAPPKPAAAH